MNHKGQTLIIFVIMIPVLILAALVIDLGIMSYEKTKLSGITTTILKEFYEKRENDCETEIRKLYEKNHIPVENLKVVGTKEYLEIENQYEIKSVFGTLIGINKYSLSIHKKIRKENDKFIIQKE